MKKMLALILALAMVLSMSVVAFAADVTIGQDTEGNLTNQPASSTVAVDVTGHKTVYHVYVKWTDMKFEYTMGTWNPETHTYDSGSWEDDEATIEVENHSNAQVTVAATVNNTNKTVQGEVTANVSVDKATLASADAAEYRTTASTVAAGYKKGDVATITVTATGDPQAMGTDLVVGTVVVTIGKVST